MARRRKRRRIMPREGRMVDGSYRTPYDDGYNAGAKARLKDDRSLVPLCRETDGFVDVDNRTYIVDPMPNQVVEVDKQIGKEQTGEKLRVVVRDKIQYARNRYYGQLVPQTKVTRRRGSVMSQPRAFWQGVDKGLAEKDAKAAKRAAQQSESRRVINACRAKLGKSDADKAAKRLGGWKALAMVLDIELNLEHWA